ncbi:MAG: hypothetical protein ACXVC0_04400 [Bdellovibrionota bacterium]
MKVLCLVGIAALAIAVEQPAFGGEECPFKSQHNKLKDQVKKFQATPPAQAADSGQKLGQGTHSDNAKKATDSGNDCVARANALMKKLTDLKDKLEGESAKCEQELNENKEEITKTQGFISSCSAAAAEAKAQGDKSGDNKDKMGEDKSKGGGDGKMPDMPKIPPQKKDPQGPDPAQVEAQRQARINSCKAAANTTLQSRESGCESQYSYDPNHAVASQLQLQNECKQNAIFASQTDINNCDAANPPGSTSSLPTAPDNFTSSVPTISTTTH